MLEANDKFGKFEFRPLEPGFGVTIGNSLRRILLSSLEGYAINTIRIAGVEHEFSSVPGVKEDVTNIILNLKQVRFKQVVEEFENEKVSITVENSTEFKASDIGKYLTGFEVLNPDLVICHLDSKASMQIDRLRQARAGSYDGWFHPPEGRTEGGCQDPHLPLHAVL